MKKAYLIILLLIFSFGGYCLTPPTVQCLQLRNNNTRLYVAWDNSSDCSQFTKYLIYVNNVLRDSISPSSGYTMCNYGSLVINNIPSSASYNCYIVAKDANGATYTSNTIQTIGITVTASTDGAYAYLSWESPSTQVGSTWGDFFYLYKKRSFESDFPLTPFATVSNNTLTYTDTADVCNTSCSYQVGITNYYSDLDNCLFKTTIGTVILIDRTQPHTPVLDSVSVTADNQVILGFHAPDPYMMGYIIYYNNNGWVPVDTVYNTTLWHDPNGGSRCYRIAVLDSCMNSSPIIIDEQCNMILSVGNTDACHQTASISWDGYTNMQDGLDHYEIFISSDNGVTWQSAGTTTNTSHVLTDLQLNTPYIVFVRAYNNGGTITSSSNREHIELSANATADVSYIRYVSVVDNHYFHILVHTSGDTLAFNSITLQRSEDGINFTSFQTLSHHSDADYDFADSTVAVDKKLYYYQTFITNTCNMPSGYSNISHNILLTGNATSAQENVLQWNNYGTWSGDVESFTINRKLETETSFNEIPEILTPATVNTYYDDVSQLYGSGSKFIYLVQAHEALDTFGFADVSNSNYLAVMQLPTTYIPNAFSPLGPNNKVFMPYNSFVSPDKYSLTIFSRFGNIVFKTTNPYEGWNGYINGKLAPMAVYSYRMYYVLPDGTPYEKIGSVTLIY